MALEQGFLFGSAAFGLVQAVLADLPLLAALNGLWAGEASSGLWRAFALIAAYWLVLSAPFFFAGCCVSWAIETYAAQLRRLYAISTGQSNN